MEFSLRKSISFPFKRHSCQNIFSSSSSPSIGEHHPILPHHRHDEYDDASGHHPMTSTPPGDHQVIVKVESSDDIIQSNTTFNNGNITSLYHKKGEENKIGRPPFSNMAEFSFRQAAEDPTLSPSDSLIGKFLEQEQELQGLQRRHNMSGELSVDIDIDEVDMEDDHLRRQQQQQQQQQLQQQQQQQYMNSHHDNHSIRRQVLQGLPPLPPDCLSRQSLSYRSDIQSPEIANGNGNKLTQMLNTRSNSISSNNNMDAASRETRVSFQESFNPYNHPNMIRQSSSEVDDDDDDNDDDASSSKAGDHGNNHHHDVYDEEFGSTTRVVGGGGVSVHRRRSKNSNNNSNNANLKEREMMNNANSSSNHDRGDDLNEVIRCTSNSSSRKMSSTVSIAKTRSRLMDPPPTPFDQRSTSGVIPKSGQILNNNSNSNNHNNNNNNKSGLLGKSSMGDEEEEDPFLEDDLPEEYKRGQISTLLILEWVSLVILIGSLVCSLVIPVLRHKSIWKLKLWKWEVFGLSLISGRLVSGWVIKVLVFFIERNFLLRKRVLYFVYGLKKAVQNVIWLGLLILTWHCIFDNKVATQATSEPLKIVTKLLVIGEGGAVLWLLKTLMVKVCASTFHVNAFFDRIQESLFNQFVIETLSAPPLFDLRSAREEEERAMAEVQMLQNAGINIPLDLKTSVLERSKSATVGLQHLYSQNSKTLGTGTVSQPIKSPVRQSVGLSGPIGKKYHDEGIPIDRLHRLNQKNVSAWNMKRLIRIVRHGFLTTLDERIENTNTTHEDESTTQIRSEVEAKAAAKKIFRNVARPRSRYIYLSDLMRFMQEDEAYKTMSLFEGASEAGRISKSALKNWVVNAFRERRALALTLSDTKTAVNKLHKMVDVLVSIIIILIAVIALNIIPSKSILFLSSQLVVVAFVFGNTCKNVFESIIFLFVIHPFDVGDRCEIDGVQMVVEEMNILTTVFLRYDNQKIIYPNYILISKPIHNYYRSPDMGDAVEFCLHVATPPEKVALIRQRITSYIVNKKEHWYPDPMIVVKDAENLYMLRIAIWVTHRMNHQDMGERWVRRAQLIEECVKIFRELDIEYRVYPMNVNVNSMPPVFFPPSNMGADPFIAEGAKEVAHH
ncbi:mechanosensitive ion channel protein 6-like [Chenopodium quinoa]|uniref:mechanosensitive ion channel protein 6-like n=1 Tax=Chenopodium quinoa TaxID=63459 RepID=UPI000B7708BF|nr:mechanosensitive ion channel protein 6-like [Chenopodium quinoa]